MAEDPAAAHARQLRARAGSLVVREHQSRRDLTKVAQYEVLGNEEKNRSVPSDDRNARLLVLHATQLWSGAGQKAASANPRPKRKNLNNFS
jgi:hypothetical protein